MLSYTAFRVIALLHGRTGNNPARLRNYTIERPQVDEEIIALVEQRVTTHDNDPEAHGLAVLRRQVELIDSCTGLWSLSAADPFDGPDGLFTTAPTGGQTWTAIGGSQLSRAGGKAVTSDGNLRGTYLVASVPNGQVEADLASGSGASEASLYIRFQSNGNYLLLQRKPDGFVGLFRVVGGVTAVISPPSIARPVMVGERFKVRFVGSKIWVLWVAGGVEELLFDVTEAQFATAGSHGLRLLGTGSADNFRILKREAL